MPFDIYILPTKPLFTFLLFGATSKITFQWLFFLFFGLIFSFALQELCQNFSIYITPPKPAVLLNEKKKHLLFIPIFLYYSFGFYILIFITLWRIRLDEKKILFDNLTCHKFIESDFTENSPVFLFERLRREEKKSLSKFDWHCETLIRGFFVLFRVTWAPCYQGSRNVMLQPE